MSIAAFETREEKEKRLLRPLDWACSVVFFSFVFGALFWFEGKIDRTVLAGFLVIGMGAASALLLWAKIRILNAARGRG